ncbi:transposase [Mesorhizobium sp. A556]
MPAAWVADPSRRHAQGQGLHPSRGDVIDARELAAYGLERWVSLALWCAPEPCEAKLKALVRRRYDLVAIKVAEQNRAKAPNGKELAASYKAVLAVIKRQIEAVDEAIHALGCSSPLKQKIAVATAIKGIAETTAAALARHPNESGKRIGYRRMRGGRTAIRTILFMPAMQAARGHGKFATFYKRLTAAGKKPMLALAAVMRKAQRRKNSTELMTGVGSPTVCQPYRLMARRGPVFSKRSMRKAKQLL